MIKKLFTLVLIEITLLFPGCKRQERIELEFINEGEPLFTIGEDSEVADKPGIYKGIKYFCLDDNNNIYIGDIFERKIDKFNDIAEYQHSIGKKGQGPGEFEAIAPFAVNSRGLLYTFSIKKKFIVFDPRGEFMKEVSFPDKLKKAYAESLKIDNDDNVFVLFNSIEDGFQIAKFDKDLNNYLIIHKDNKRKPLDYTPASQLPPILIDFDFDTENNVYVTASVDYAIFAYSSAGRLLKEFRLDDHRSRINHRDLLMNYGTDILDLSEGNKDLLKTLKGYSAYLPSVFGINVDDNRLYLWTSKQDSEYKFVIDVYDLKFRKIGSASYYNYLPSNNAIIKKNRLYIPNLSSDDLELKKKVGRLSVFNLPYRLLVYEILNK